MRCCHLPLPDPETQDPEPICRPTLGPSPHPRGAPPARSGLDIPGATSCPTFTGKRLLPRGELQAHRYSFHDSRSLGHSPGCPRGMNFGTRAKAPFHHKRSCPATSS